ncbi:MAG TPA: hypothetical protein VMX16_02080 [Terriglobia bacterium]|nr:hypothetical protein [Terriglobia bacterium]
MAKFRVIRPVEYNHKLYLPAALTGGGIPETTASAGSGREIPVDKSGIIEIARQAASSFAQGQIEILKIQKEPASRRR